MIRKSALIVVGVVAVCVGLSTWLIDDLLVAWTAESVISKLTHAEVKIRGLDIAPLDMRVAFDKVQLQDSESPWKNMLEAGPADFDVKGMQLFAKKLVVDEMTLTNLTFGKLRPGQTPPPPPSPEEAAAAQEEQQQQEQAQAAEEAKTSEKKKKDTVDSLKKGLGKVSGNLPVVDLGSVTKKLDVEKFVKPDKLASVVAVNQASKDANEKSVYWNKRMADTPLPRDLQQIQVDYDKVKAGGFNTVPQAQATLQSLDALNKRMASARKEYNDLSQGSSRDFAAVRKSYNEVNRLVDQDVADAKKLAKLGDINAKEAGKMLFGGPVLQKFKDVLGYMAMARRFMSSGEPRPKPKRRAGHTVVFPVTSRAYPALFIKKAMLGGSILDEEGNPTLDLSGQVLNIASSQKVYGQPTTLDMSAVNHGQGTAYQVNGLFDHRNEVALDTLTIKGSGLKLGDIALRKDPDGVWPESLTAPESDVDVKASLTGEMVNADIVLTAKQVKFMFAPLAAGDAKNREMSNAMREMFDDFRSIQMKATLSGPLNDLQFNVASNVNDALSKKLNQMIGKKTKEADERIRKAVNAQVEAKKAELEKSMKSQQAQVEAKLKQQADAMNVLQKQIDGTKAEAERKGKAQVEDKAKKALEGLFRR